MFFWSSLAFLMIQQMLAIWSLVPLPFLKPVWTSGSSQFIYCWSLACRILSITLLACEMNAFCGSLSILCSQRWRGSIQSTKTILGADCGSDHKLLIAKFRLKLKKVGKTSRPFRYDLNPVPYNYIMEVRNRLKRLDLIDRVPNELWIEVHDIV